MRSLVRVLRCFVAASVAAMLSTSILVGQTNPTPQTLPVSQDFGTSGFTSMPPGFVIWNGISGTVVNTQVLAETSAPTGNATITAAAIIQQAGGAYGYVANGNAQVYIQTSGNATNGVDQLALAINTTDIINVKVGYSITAISDITRSVGVVLQYRVGTTGVWATVPASLYFHGNSDRLQGAKDVFTDLILPPDAGNQPVVQLRWAVWRGVESGTSASVGFDDISVVSAGNGIFVPNPRLFSVNYVSESAMNIGWEAPAYGDDSVLVFVREDLPVDFVPTVPGHTLLGASSDYPKAAAFGASKLVYNGTDNAVTVTGLLEHKKYYFKSFAYKDTGFSAGTPVIMDTAEVHGVAHLVTLTGNRHVKLQWQNYAGPQGVFWDEVVIVGASGKDVSAIPSGNGSSYTANAFFGQGTSVGAGTYVVYKGTADTVTVMGLTNAASYAFRVFVRNGSSWSALWRSPIATAIPSDGPIIPEVPQTISPADGSASIPVTPRLNWSAVQGAASYRVQVSLQSDFVLTVLDDSTITGNSMVLAPLQMQTKYYWHVRAANSAGSSEYSPTAVFTTATAYQVPQQVLFAGQSGTTLLANIVTSYKPSTTQGYPPPALFAEVYRLPNSNVRCVYTGYEGAGGSGLNVEHTFPQSKGASGQAQSDMHHLFPTQIGVNSDRGNYPYGDIPDNEVSYWYRLTTKTQFKPTLLIEEYSKVKSGVIFEPRADHKGNIARALCYFYTMYKSQADAADPVFFRNQLSTIYRWHYLDPVDSLEHARTFLIAKYESGKPNPFIVDTTLVRRAYFPEIQVGVVSQRAVMPSIAMLAQNYPNPFNPATALEFVLSENTRATVVVYNMLGQKVATLFDGPATAGEFYHVTFDASRFASGIYVAKLEWNGSSLMKKMLLLR
ncbi:MAG: endonuclease [Ignavibacteriales bacterium]|nr:endonuclease [Ignavibacteriales bacterium]